MKKIVQNIVLPAIFLLSLYPASAGAMEQKKQFVPASNKSSIIFDIISQKKMNESVKIIKLKELLKDPNVSVKTNSSHGTQPIHDAAAYGYKKIIKLLLTHGASIDDLDTRGAKPIRIAAFFNQLETVKWFLKHGTNINETNSIGTRLIHYVAGMGKNGRIELMKFLLANGATINDRTTNGQRPIHFATAMGNTEMVEFLLTQGAPINDTTTAGKTVMQVAVDSGKREMVKWLIQHGAKIDDNLRPYGKPICFAVINGQIDMIQFLVEHGATIDQSVIGLAHLITDPVKKTTVENYLTEMGAFFSVNSDIFQLRLIKLFEKVESYEAQKRALQDLLTWTSYRDHFFADHVYDTMHILFTPNVLERFGFTYKNVKEFYVAVARHAPSSLKAKEWIYSCLTLCKGNIFKSSLGSFEYEIKNILETKLDDTDKEEVTRHYNKTVLFGQNMYAAALNKKFLNLKIK